MLKMSYALKNAELVHISEVESGLKCGCICPSCNAKLVARKGSIKEHHFAHAKDEDCQKGTETVLHMMAKSILEKEKRIKVPKVLVLTKFTCVHYQGHDFPYGKDEILSEEMYINFDRVELEKKINEFIPDVALYSGSQCLLVEIRVSHGIDENKMAKIKSSDISVLEVDLSAFKGTITENELRNLLIEDISNKQWIYNKKAEYYKNNWFNLCEKFSISKRENKTAKYEYYKYFYVVENCPQNKKVYNKQSYAHIKTDCFCCEYCIEIVDYHKFDISIMYCSGKNKISSIKELKNHLKLNSK